MVMNLEERVMRNAGIWLDHTTPERHRATVGLCEDCMERRVLYKEGGKMMCKACIDKQTKLREMDENRVYCHKFNNDCRERNRKKYGRLCFLCGKDETSNGRRLSVHHVDMNKDQGCNDHAWKLVPLCKSCHAHGHSKLWQARIEYLLTKDYL